MNDISMIPIYSVCFSTPNIIYSGGLYSYISTYDLSLVGVNNTNIEIPELFELYQNYPNPFNPETKIKFHLAEEGNVELVIYDITGKEVAILINSHKNPGSHEILFNGKGFSSGIYFYRINFNGASNHFSETKKMLLVK